MQSFGNYNINPNPPVYVGGGEKRKKKKEEKPSEDIASKIALPIAVTAGAALAICAGVFGVNKALGGGKKVVGETAKKTAGTVKDGITIEAAKSKSLQFLANITNNKSTTYQDLKNAQSYSNLVLNFIKQSSTKVPDVLTKYNNLLNKLVTKYATNASTNNPFTFDTDDQNEINNLSSSLSLRNLLNNTQPKQITQNNKDEKIPTAEITPENTLQSTNIDSIKSFTNAEIKQKTENETTDYYLSGAITDSQKPQQTKYVKISDLSAEKLKLLIESDSFSEIIKYVKTQYLSNLLASLDLNSPKYATIIEQLKQNVNTSADKDMEKSKILYWILAAKTKQSKKLSDIIKKLSDNDLINEESVFQCLQYNGIITKQNTTPQTCAFTDIGTNILELVINEGYLSLDKLDELVRSKKITNYENKSLGLKIEQGNLFVSPKFIHTSYQTLLNKNETLDIFQAYAFIELLSPKGKEKYTKDLPTIDQVTTEDNKNVINHLCEKIKTTEFESADFKIQGYANYSDVKKNVEQKLSQKSQAPVDTSAIDDLLQKTPDPNSVIDKIPNDSQINTVEIMSSIGEETDSKYYLAFEAQNLTFKNKKPTNYTFYGMEQPTQAFFYELKLDMSPDKMLKLLENEKIKSVILQNTDFLTAYLDKLTELVGINTAHSNTEKLKELKNQLQDIADGDIEKLDGAKMRFEYRITDQENLQQKIEAFDKDKTAEKLFDNFKALKEQIALDDRFQPGKTYYVLFKYGVIREGTCDFIQNSNRKLVFPIYEINVDNKNNVTISKYTSQNCYITYTKPAAFWKSSNITVTSNPIKDAIEEMQTATKSSSVGDMEKTNLLKNLFNLLSSQEVQSQLKFTYPSQIKKLLQCQNIDSAMKILDEERDLLEALNNVSITKEYSKQKDINQEKEIPFCTILGKQSTSPSFFSNEIPLFNLFDNIEYNVYFKQIEKKKGTEKYDIAINYCTKKSLKTVYMHISVTDNKNSIEVDYNGQKITYNISERTLDIPPGVTLDSEEKTIIDYFIFNKLSKKQRIIFAKNQLSQLSQQKKKYSDCCSTTAPKNQQEVLSLQAQLVFYIDYLINYDSTYNKENKKAWNAIYKGNGIINDLKRDLYVDNKGQLSFTTATNSSPTTSNPSALAFGQYMHIESLSEKSKPNVDFSPFEKKSNDYG